jgi:hypothetical protein
MGIKPVIFATWEAEIRSIAVQRKPGQKVHESPSAPIAEHGGAPLSSPSKQGSTNRRLVVQASPGIKQDIAHK